jgi:hypothetical protein
VNLRPAEVGERCAPRKRPGSGSSRPISAADVSPIESQLSRGATPVGTLALGESEASEMHSKCVLGRVRKKCGILHSADLMRAYTSL